MKKLWLLFLAIPCLIVLPLSAQNTEAQQLFDEGLQIFWSGGAITDAFDKLDAAVEIDPTFADAYAYRSYIGRSITFGEENADVVADFSRAIELAPERPLGYVARARYNFDLGAVDAAIEDIEYALSLDPTEPAALYNRGLFYGQDNQYEEAIEVLAQVTEPYTPVLSYRGYIYMVYAESFDPINQTFLELAYQDYYQTLTINPNDVYALNDIGLIYWHRGDYVTALDYFEYTLSLASDFETAQVNADIIREFALKQAAQGMVSQFEIPTAAETVIAASPLETPAAPQTAQTVNQPLNGLIAFTSTRDAYIEIYAMNPNGSLPIRLTNNFANDVEPQWSPDGKQIVYTSYQDGNGEIYLMDADGGRQRNISSHPATDMKAGWSPDGTQIVFVSDRDGNFEIYTMPADGGSATRLTNSPGLDTYPSWSPDGSQIAYVSDYQIYLMGSDGSNPTLLLPDADADQNAPAWSPDGSQLALAYHRKIHIVNADGTNLRELTNNVGNNVNYEMNPEWSPDGKQIVFTYNLGFNGEIYVANVESGSSRSLSNNVKDDQYASWQPVLDGVVQVIQPTATRVIPTSTPVNRVGIIFEEVINGYPPIDPLNCGFYDTTYSIQALAGDVLEISLSCNAAASCGLFIPGKGFGNILVQNRIQIGGSESVTFVVPEDDTYYIGVRGYTDLDMRQEYCLEAILTLSIVQRRG